MKILICGASGFIGRHMTDAMKAAGHEVVRGVRKPENTGDIAVDFTKDVNKEAWLPRLNGIDAVINAVGVLRDTQTQPMILLHERTPLALFAACQEAGVKRIVQVSALGVDRGVETTYFTSRRAAEAYLSKLPDPVRALILRPSAIYGDDVYAASAKMFRFLARMPVHFLPAGGKQELQSVHIDDVCEAVARWLADGDAKSQTVDCVGTDATSLRGLLDSYCQQQGYSVLCHISIPEVFIKLAASVGDAIPASPLCTDTWRMLTAGNTGNVEAFARLLGRRPRSYRTFISRKP